MSVDTIADAAVWRLATTYARMGARVKDVSGVRLRGLGRLLRLVRGDRAITLAGRRYWFDARIAGSYDLLVGGRFNEPETHAFLTHVLDRSDQPLTFVDVGANVGEFLISVAGHARTARAIGFEPHPLCADACERSAALNDFTHVRVERALVGDGEVHPFRVDETCPNVSGIGPGGEPFRTLRLDERLAEVRAPVILLIDVEGAEPLVLRGASRMLARVRPLVIFEYNHVSRSRYPLDEVRGLLGEGYRVHRLRADGRLDAHVEESWNCVAVPSDTAFAETCAPLVEV